MSIRRTIHPDATLLRMLDLRDEGLPMAEIARVISTARNPINRNQVIGALNRIDSDLRVYDDAPHRNGEMPAGWWRAGLAKQKVAA